MGIMPRRKSQRSAWSGRKLLPLDQGRTEPGASLQPAVPGSPGAELMAGPWAVGLGSGLPICQCVLCPKKPSVRRGGRGSRAGAGPGALTGRSPRCRTHRRSPWQIPGARHWSGRGETGSRGEASVLHTPALAFPRKATHSPRRTGADLQGDVVEGVHVGSTPQEPLIQNDQEDDVDARQEAQPYVHQQEDQVETLWVQAEGRAEPGLAAGEREAAIPPVAPVLGDTDEEEGWQPGIESQHPAGLPDPRIWVTPSLYPIPHPRPHGSPLWPLCSRHSYSLECHSTSPHVGSLCHCPKLSVDQGHLLL